MLMKFQVTPYVKMLPCELPEQFTVSEEIVSSVVVNKDIRIQ